MKQNFGTLILTLAIISGCMIYGIANANAFTIDWSGCGAGSMCTANGYICKPL